MIDFGSVCSGIESASVALEPLGFRASWFSEIEKFPSAVLRHHWPATPNLGDMTRLPWLIRAGLVPAPSVLIGGTPCQAFSVAGGRGSLADERGGLTLSYVGVLNAIDEQRPGNEAVCVWENVPGVLSTADNAFGCFLGKLAGDDVAMEPGPRPAAGKSSTFWGWSKTKGVHCPKWPKSGAVVGPRRRIAWRVLDAQYFGLAQRRKRVFVVASARGGFDPCAVLFEPESVRRDTPPSREEGPAVAALTSCGVGTCGADDNQGQAGHLIPLQNLAVPVQNATRGKSQNGLGIGAPDSPMYTLDQGSQHAVGVSGDISHTLRGEGFDGSEDGCGRGVPVVAVHGTQDPDVRTECAHTLGRNNEELAPTLNCNHEQPIASTGVASVRRLTPVECERLQGFPDNHTLLPNCGGESPARLKPSADGPRYKAIGNSKAVPVVQWVGRRLKQELTRCDRY